MKKGTKTPPLRKGREKTPPAPPPERLTPFSRAGPLLKGRKTFETAILKKLAKKAGVKIITEPEWGYAGQIQLPDGRNKYYLNTAFDLNPLGASRVSSDKSYAQFFMKRMGYRTIPGKVFFTKRWCRIIKSSHGPDKAFQFAKKLGLPVLVKPNSLSQGTGVAVVHNKSEFLKAVASFSNRARAFLVQKFIRGRDYRIVVLDDKIISAYERRALSVIGDGKSSILLLLKKKQKEFIKRGRDTKINFNDLRIKNHLKHLTLPLLNKEGLGEVLSPLPEGQRGRVGWRSGLTLHSVPARNQELTLLDNSNLSTGGEAVDVTEMIHKSFKQLAVRLTRDMGLRYSGVDLITSGDITKPLKNYWILEVNDAPGIDHYASYGAKQKKIVEDMYLQVLKALKR